jgi:predicted MFS family arabinose efflux permease
VSPDEARLPALISVLTLAASLGAANIHYSQPLLPGIAHDLGVSLGMVALIPSASQIGFAFGILLILPLADMLERRRLIVIMHLAVAVALMMSAFAPNRGILMIGALLIGLAGVGPQLLTPFAALLTPPAAQGRAVSRVLSGVLMGVLVAKIVGGLVAQGIGWRALYLFAAALMVATAAYLRFALPVSAPVAPPTYRELIGSIVTLVREEPQARRHALYGALTFAGFLGFWSTYALYLYEAFGYGPGIAGLFGIAGIAGSAAAFLAGKQIDRGHFVICCVIAAALIVAGFAILLFGSGHVAGIVIGVLFLDGGVGLSHASNQSAAFKLRPDARGRINTVYLSGVFFGGSAGSFISAMLYQQWGWSAVCLFGGASALTLGALALTAPKFVAGASAHSFAASDEAISA